MKENRPAALRKRWADESSAAALLTSVGAFLADGRIGGGLDLRGAEIGGGAGPLAEFQLSGKSYSGLDVSHGKGALVVHRSTVADLRAEGFQFDRASYFGKSVVTGANLTGFKGRFGATDTQFLGCDFSSSTFKGGFNEYGFRRCRFERCVFDAATWQNAFFKACEFSECVLATARFSRCYVAGVKIVGDVDSAALFDDCDVRSLYVNGVKVAGAA